MLRRLREKNLRAWVPGYARHLVSRATSRPYRGHRHLLFALCDHFEPFWRQPPRAVAEARLSAWRQGYPRLAGRFRDADGRPPRHSFFFPAEQYTPELLEGLADLARLRLAEVELHLHHDGDTAVSLEATIRRAIGRYASHGHLAREDNLPRYAFIHGNWCLANARRDGRFCGVDRELPLLFDTGCYADFTFPAAPDESQPGTVNEITWPDGDLGRPRAYEHGQRAAVGRVFADRILLIAGPLAPAFTWQSGLRIENGALTAADPATPARLRTWVAQNIHIAGRPDWVFVKVHTHGAPEAQAAALLGEPAQKLHEALAALYNDGVRWSLHYVTAREMYNLALAAMEGSSGAPAEFFDHRLGPPPVAASPSAS